MKRIFIVQNTPLNEPLPLSVYLTSLLKNIERDSEFELNLIVSKSENVPENIIKLCNKIYQVNANPYSVKDNVKFSFSVYSILQKENKKGKIDVIHCFYPNSSLLGAILFKILNKNVKIIYDVRSPWIEMSVERGHVKNATVIYKRILYTEEKLLCKFVDYFIFISDGLKKYYINTFSINPDKKILVSPTGVDLKVFKRINTNIRKKFNISNKEILIGHVGSVDTSRKVDNFLKIFKKLPKNVKLMFVGGGDNMENLRELSKNMGIKDRVIFTGKVEHEEIPKYINAFDYGLCHLPNTFLYANSVPLKILEYLSCGVPVLASNLKAHKELNKQIKGITIYSKSLRLPKTTKLISLGIENFSWEKIVNNYLGVWANE